MAFATVTLGIIELNNNYQNIFAMDFTEAKSDGINVTLIKTADSAKITTLKEYFKEELKEEFLDSIKASMHPAYDTVYQDVVKDESLLDTINYLKKKLKEIQNNEPLVENAINPGSSGGGGEVGEEWVKTTAKLLESMVPVQAAKVLSQYSDNEARNVIYKMKNKKAAEILSLLNPEYVNRITKPVL